MPERVDQLYLDSVASRVAASLTDHAQIPLFSESAAGLRLEDAYRVTLRLRAAFEGRGERITGRKIGFTNRDMWEAHGVRAPIWGYCTDRTTFDLAATPVQRAQDFAEPRIEPEIMFGLGRAPDPSMDEGRLLDCIDWVSLGFEMVQSIYPGWRFAAADTVAANALHGTLLIGNRHPIAPRKAAWLTELGTFRAELYCGGQLVHSGGGDFVLGSPLRALKHLVALLADDPVNPPLQAGEVVSTGTLTLAPPVQGGQNWSARVQGIALEDVSITIEA